MGASGNFSASRRNGEAPIWMSPIGRPATIENRKNWQTATTAMTGDSFSRPHFMSVKPTSPFSTIQSMKEPSCPAQLAEIR